MEIAKLCLPQKKGYAFDFTKKNARSMGRTSKGVIGMRLKGDDEVIDMVIADDTRSLLTVTKNGYGKRTKVSDYRQIGRGGMGVINIKCSERNGDVVSIKEVTDEDEVFIISKKGIIIRTQARSISEIGRNTQGVRVMRLSNEDHVVACAKVVREEEAEEKANQETDTE